MLLYPKTCTSGRRSTAAMCFYRKHIRPTSPKVTRPSISPYGCRNKPSRPILMQSDSPENVFFCTFARSFCTKNEKHRSFSPQNELYLSRSSVWSRFLFLREPSLQEITVSTFSIQLGQIRRKSRLILRREILISRIFQGKKARAIMRGERVLLLKLLQNPTA